MTKAAKRPKVVPLWLEFQCNADDCMDYTKFRVYACWVDNRFYCSHAGPLTPKQADRFIHECVVCPVCGNRVAYQGPKPCDRAGETS